MKKTVQDIRQTNLRELLEEQHNNDLTNLSEAIGRAQTTVRKYLSKNQSRNINTATARSIERSLGLDSGYMDEEYHGNLNVYYVTLKVSRNFTFDVVQRIYEYKEAVECSALLGEYDILIKVEVPSFHELQVFYDKLSRMPGVQRTRTYPAVDTIRWQRAQSAYNVLKNPNKFTNYAEEYKHKRILEYMDEIRKLEGGQISSDGLLQNAVDLSDLMRKVKRQYLAIRLHNETYHNEAVYMASEQERLIAGVKVKRIITLPESMPNDPMQQTEFDDLLNIANELIRIGSEIRFLFVERWVASAKNNLPECFAVVDDEYVYLRRGNTHSQLLTGNDDLTSYQRAFTVNWDRALTMDELKTACKLL